MGSDGARARQAAIGYDHGQLVISLDPLTTWGWYVLSAFPEFKVSFCCALKSNTGTKRSLTTAHKHSPHTHTHSLFYGILICVYLFVCLFFGLMVYHKHSPAPTLMVSRRWITLDLVK